MTKKRKIKEKRESFEQHRSAVAYFVSIKRRKQLFFLSLFPYALYTSGWEQKKKIINKIGEHYFFYRIKFQALLYKAVLAAGVKKKKR